MSVMGVIVPFVLSVLIKNEYEFIELAEPEGGFCGMPGPSSAAPRPFELRRALRTSTPRAKERDALTGICRGGAPMPPRSRRSARPFRIRAGICPAGAKPPPDCMEKQDFIDAAASTSLTTAMFYGVTGVLSGVFAFGHWMRGAYRM